MPTKPSPWLQVAFSYIFVTAQFGAPAILSLSGMYPTGVDRALMQTLVDICAPVFFPLKRLILSTAWPLFPSGRNSLGYLHVSLTLTVNALTEP